MNIKKLSALTILISTILFSGHLASETNLELAKKHLKKAHKALINKKYKKMALQLKHVFQYSEGNKAIEKNALELLDLAHKERGQKRIPVDWKLPKDIDYLKVGFRTQYNKAADYTGYKIDVVGLTEEPENLEQLRIVKYPNQIIIDKIKGIGSFDSWKNEDDRGFYLGRRFESPKFDGLYLIQIKLKGQDLVNGWFISSKMKSSKTPTIKTPIDGTIFNTPNPEFVWNNFLSPEYQNFEQRKLYLKITHFNSKRKTVWWWLSEKDPTRERVTLGDEGIGAHILKPGTYLLHLNYGERKKFGPIKLSRDSRTVVGFEVK